MQLPVSSTTMSRLSAWMLAWLVILLLPVGSPIAQQTAEQRQRAIQVYIQRSWQTLTRSPKDLATAAVDPKFPPGPEHRSVVYIPSSENVDKLESVLLSEMSPADFARIRLEKLSPDATEIKQPGLLYLPHPYVVPGGRFNEMYGWDSYFIQLGLLRAGEIELARDMADNFLYEIENYGKILNANRTYYLTRSQPPFLTQMILGVFRRTGDKEWLARSVPAIEAYYQYWTTGPHLVKENGLSRYYDSGTGPAPEVVADERDEQGRSHYDRVREYYRTHQVADYNPTAYYDRRTDQLTELFYKADRSMRESGFDPSNRFGQFNADILNYTPICLNSLLYLMEIQAADIQRILGNGSVSKVWAKRARERRNRVNKLMWDPKDGLYYDYNFKTNSLRRYPFVTTFYPLWAGIASPAQAARLVRNLRLFERGGGLQTSTTKSGSQWDAPFGWAPMQVIAVAGLRRYGYRLPADRIARKFLSLVLKEFQEHNVIVEKYDVERCDSQLRVGLKFGYSSNEIGFGWTNAAFLELYAGLPKGPRHDLLGVSGCPTLNLLQKPLLLERGP